VFIDALGDIILIKSKKKRAVVLLLTLVMLLSTVSSLVMVTPAEDMNARAFSTSFVLNNFVTDVTMWDLSQSPPEPVIPGYPTYIGNNYRFEITFKESATLQLAYTSTAPAPPVASPPGG